MLSILIPTYNCEVYELVEELASQSKLLSEIREIIVCDDGSTQESVKLKNSQVTKFDKVCYIQNKDNLGRTQVRQLLAQRAKSDWLLFLDADVWPGSNRFLINYLDFLKKNKTVVVFGGYSYQGIIPDPKYSLRLKYGSEREEASAFTREKKPYAYVFSGNFLTDRKIFQKYNYQGEGKFYGLDIYFAYCLFRDNVKIAHIDNPIIHKGLEINEVFFEKAVGSLKNRKELLAGLPNIEKVNGLLKYYNLLKQVGLLPIAKQLFKITAPYLKQKSLKNDPNLRCFDLYRLGYICTL